ncbi:S-adenosyl-L-methionine-dependent methyltransferase, partial [Backusella circina FSU 941]
MSRPSSKSSSKSDLISCSDTLVDPKSAIINGNKCPSQLLKLDEDEVDRMQLKNDLVKLAFEGEFNLPFDYNDLSEGKILDVGCGGGSWCIDLSQKYPAIEVIGVDSDDIFPAQRNLPNNCQLLVCDVLEDNGLSIFPDASFDVIHIRFMVLTFTTEQYSQVITDCWRLLKPGGYIEILETDLTIYSPGPVTMKLNGEMLEMAKSRGMNPCTQANELEKLVPKEAINPQIKYRSIPVGLWGGRIGVLLKDDINYMLRKLQPAICEHVQKSEQDKQAFEQDIITVAREMEQYHSFSNFHFYTAQKPLKKLNNPNSNSNSNTSSANIVQNY